MQVLSLARRLEELEVTDMVMIDEDAEVEESEEERKKETRTSEDGLHVQNLRLHCLQMDFFVNSFITGSNSPYMPIAKGLTELNLTDIRPEWTSIMASLWQASASTLKTLKLTFTMSWLAHCKCVYSVYEFDTNILLS